MFITEPVISVLAIGYTMLGKTLIKMTPPSLSKFDVEDAVKLIFSSNCSNVRFYKRLSNQAKNYP